MSENNACIRVSLPHFALAILVTLNIISGQVSTAWVNRYNGPGNGIDEACAVAVDDLGNVYVTGKSEANGTYIDFATIKYNSEGVEQWVAWYDGPGTGVEDLDSPYAMVVDDLGNIYVTGVSDNAAGDGDFLTVKYNPDGIEQWTARYAGPGERLDYAIAITVDKSGNVYITGSSWGNGGAEDYVTIKYNSSGVEQWLVRYGGTGYKDIPAAIGIDALGNVYVTGYSQDPIWEPDYLTIKYDNNGNEQWTRRIDRLGYDFARSLTIDYFGNVYVTGGSQGAHGYDYLTRKYDTNGNTIWTAIYDNEGEEASTLTVHLDGNGSVYVTGSSGNVGTGYDVTTIKYLADNGAEQWVARYNGTADLHDGGNAIACDVFGNVYVTGYAYNTGELYDYVTIKYDPDGNEQWVEIYNGVGGGGSDRAQSIAVDDFGNVYVTGNSRGSGTGSSDYATIKYVQGGVAKTDDALSLAYNGNRHLVRKPNTTEELHLVFTHTNGIYYTFSSNGGSQWSYPIRIGDGKFPAITLDPPGLPSVTWTDDQGNLWYRRKVDQTQWSGIYAIYNPLNPFAPDVNSPPSIAILDDQPDDIVHILYTLTGKIATNGVVHSVYDYEFPIDDPYSETSYLIEYCEAVAIPPARSHPSIVKDDWNTLHAVWQRRDTVCYATKIENQPWDVWGDEFAPEGHQSAHPFVENYGDSVRVVWQHLESPTMIEEVYRAARYRTWLIFDPSQRYTQTPNSSSLYPSNAQGYFTVYVDEPQLRPQYDIFYKNKANDSPANISQTSSKSMYPHSSARFIGPTNYLYCAWLEGNVAPYEIRFTKIAFFSTPFAYLTSSNGHNPSSPYLVQRDSFIDDWQIPVDIGYQTITYQFSLKPDFRYKLKTVVYHEQSGEWREWLKIDGESQHLIKYNAYEPETMEFWIPPASYSDGNVEVVFERVAGDFATNCAIYIYQYEYEEGIAGSGGPMIKNSRLLNKTAVSLYPNPFKHSLKIKFQSLTERDVCVKLYDVSGRLVKNLHTGTLSGHSMIAWNGKDESDRVVSQGIYFLQIEDLSAGTSYCRKVLKIE